MSIVSIIFDVDLATANFMQVWHNEIDFFLYNSVFLSVLFINFLNSPICTFHKHSTFCIIFSYFLTFLENSKIQDDGSK